MCWLALKRAIPDNAKKSMLAAIHCSTIVGCSDHVAATSARLENSENAMAYQNQTCEWGKPCLFWMTWHALAARRKNRKNAAAWARINRFEKAERKEGGMKVSPGWRANLSFRPLQWVDKRNHFFLHHLGLGISPI